MLVVWRFSLFIYRFHYIFILFAKHFPDSLQMSQLVWENHPTQILQNLSEAISWKPPVMKQTTNQSQDGDSSTNGVPRAAAHQTSLNIQCVYMAAKEERGLRLVTIRKTSKSFHWPNYFLYLKIIYLNLSDFRFHFSQQNFSYSYRIYKIYRGRMRNVIWNNGIKENNSLHTIKRQAVGVVRVCGGGGCWHTNTHKHTYKLNKALRCP